MSCTLHDSPKATNDRTITKETYVPKEKMYRIPLQSAFMAMKHTRESSSQRELQGQVVSCYIMFRPTEATEAHFYYQRNVMIYQKPSILL